MPLQLTRVPYTSLNSRQKENFNYQKLSAVLADYGYVTHRLHDDWLGADFIAQHIDGESFLKIQLKSRLTLDGKYRGKAIYIAFPDLGTWYLYPHDEFLEVMEPTIQHTSSWADGQAYSYSSLNPRLRELLAPYRITGDATPID